jgi:MinD superfamily P-loop ATPase
MDEAQREKIANKALSFYIERTCKKNRKEIIPELPVDFVEAISEALITEENFVMHLENTKKFETEQQQKQDLLFKITQALYTWQISLKDLEDIYDEVLFKIP